MQILAYMIARFIYIPKLEKMFMTFWASDTLGSKFAHILYFVPATSLKLISNMLKYYNQNVILNEKVIANPNLKFIFIDTLPISLMFVFVILLFRFQKRPGMMFKIIMWTLFFPFMLIYTLYDEYQTRSDELLMWVRFHERKERQFLRKHQKKTTSLQDSRDLYMRFLLPSLIKLAKAPVKLLTNLELSDINGKKHYIEAVVISASGIQVWNSRCLTCESVIGKREDATWVTLWGEFRVHEPLAKEELLTGVQKYTLPRINNPFRRNSVLIHILREVLKKQSLPVAQYFSGIYLDNTLNPEDCNVDCNQKEQLANSGSIAMTVDYWASNHPQVLSEAEITGIYEYLKGFAHESFDEGLKQRKEWLSRYNRSCDRDVFWDLNHRLVEEETTDLKAFGINPAPELVQGF